MRSYMNGQVKVLFNCMACRVDQIIGLAFGVLRQKATWVISSSAQASLFRGRAGITAATLGTTGKRFPAT